MAEIRDGTITDVPKKLERLRYDIGEINRRFDVFACTSETLDDLRLKVDRHEAEMAELRRQVELGSALYPSLNQQAGHDKFTIPIYSGQRSTLPRFLKTFLHLSSIVLVRRRTKPQPSSNYDRQQLS